MYGGSTRMHDHVGRGEHEHSMPTYGRYHWYRAKRKASKYKIQAPPDTLSHVKPHCT
jgi:hypothetical protein